MDQLYFIQPINRVMDNLYIGNMIAARSKDILKAYNIKHIIQVSNDFQPPYADTYHYLWINVPDDLNTNLYEFFDGTYNFIEKYLKKYEPVLIHCAAGVSRSGTILIAYLMKKFAISYKDALEMARYVRPCINPNESFVHQLKIYENEVYVTKLFKLVK